MYKISLDGGFTCPNRDGTLGTRGCIFCSQGGSGDFASDRHLSVTEQIETGKAQSLAKYAGGGYIAYFQAFTSTYAPVETLRRLYGEVLSLAPFAVVIVGTRPDALPPETVDFLAELARKYEVWVELGVQSAHDSTLELIRRGHNFAAVEDAVRRLDAAGIRVV